MENNHCNQVEAIKALLNGFLSARFDKIVNLDPKVAEMTARTFFNSIIEPRLDKLMETGQRMENGLRIRQGIMAMSNNYLELVDSDGNKTITSGKGSLEQYYQAKKSKLKKSLIKSQLKKC
jgi:hypothetical protein